MAAVRGGRRRRGPQGSHEKEDRWLLTYADMITLLLALFVVLFSISSVSTSKYRTLKESLRDAFSGKVVTGGQSIMQTGSSATAKVADANSAAIMPGSSEAAKTAAAASRQEEQELQRLKQRLDAYAAQHGFSQRVETVVSRRGLVVRLLTDQVLFDSGASVLKSEGMPLLGEVSSLLQVDRRHPILVEGHTDDVPIHTSQYTSNWELSTARATEVTRYLIRRGVAAQRFGAAGYADIHPLTSNATAAGRARNRRVEVVLQRIYQLPSSDNVAPDLSKGVAP
ncbi:MAG: OmpA/MotB domain protein [Conexibacter sp.]|jgi:chemotaxis protein MotB|nr:OmpA/MotB domain protein [Conexibacter sp.]